MNVEIGAEAALFPEKEYISGIFVAVRQPRVRIPPGTHVLVLVQPRVCREGNRKLKKHSITVQLPTINNIQVLVPKSQTFNCTTRSKLNQSNDSVKAYLLTIFSFREILLNFNDDVTRQLCLFKVLRCEGRTAWSPWTQWAAASSRPGQTVSTRSVYLILYQIKI